MTTNVDMQAVEDFLYLEASYLDIPDLEKWLALYSDDGTYWMPASENQADPLNEISHFYDDRVLMEIRKRNFVHPRASSKDASVRCSHLIGNIRLQGETQNKDLVVTSNFQVVMFYRDEQRLFAGTYEHRLIPGKDLFQIRSKRVNLINPEAAHKSIIIYL